MITDILVLESYTGDQSSDRMIEFDASVEDLAPQFTISAKIVNIVRSILLLNRTIPRFNDAR